MASPAVMMPPPAQAFPYQPGPLTPKKSLGGNTSGWQGTFQGEANADFLNRDTLVGSNTGLTDFLSGAPNDSPLYHALLSQSREAIGNSYDSAVRNTKANAASRGFGYASPNVEGTEEGVRAQEAGEMAGAPAKAMEGAIAPELAAAGLKAGEASMYSGAGTSAEGDISAMQQARMSKDSSLWGSFMQMYAKLASAGMASGGGG